MCSMQNMIRHNIQDKQIIQNYIESLSCCKNSTRMADSTKSADVKQRRHTSSITNKMRGIVKQIVSYYGIVAYRICLFLSALLVSCELIDAKTLDWGYTDKIPQEQWSNNPLYLGCKEGNQQSPINIVTKNVKESGASNFKIKYKPAKGVNLSLEEYSFRITYPPNNILQMNGISYHLQTIRFKTPAENKINSLQALMEAQFFHEDSKGNKLILSVLFMEGHINPLIETLINNLPKQSNKAHFITNIDINQLLPKSFESYQFDGSLTTPPCTQGVRWIVLKQPMSMTKSQANSLQNITKPNARHVQNLANRLIVE